MDDFSLQKQLHFHSDKYPIPQNISISFFISSYIHPLKVMWSKS